MCVPVLLSVYFNQDDSRASLSRIASYWWTLIRFQDLLIWGYEVAFLSSRTDFRNNSFHSFARFFYFHFLFSCASVLINCQHDDRFMEKLRTGESFLWSTIVLKPPFSHVYFVFLVLFFFNLHICAYWLDGSSCLGNRNVDHVVPSKATFLCGSSF